MDLEKISIKDVFTREADPDNPYSHSYRLIRNPKEEVKKFSDLLHEHLMLANFGDERLLTLYQEEADSLSEWFQMAKEHPDILMDTFQKLYWSFILRVEFTRSFKGLERLLQAVFLKIPKVEEATGFGGLLQKISGKKPKSPEDLLMEMLIYEQGGLYP